MKGGEPVRLKGPGTSPALRLLLAVLIVIVVVALVYFIALVPR